jgi:GT2 family glycosyltransferase
MQFAPRISVIVCTRNRQDSIVDTLEAIRNLDYLNFETIVVDSSDAKNGKKVKTACEKIEAKYIFEPRPGLAVARNTGIGLASGEIIAFTDDDCIPEKDWLANSAAALSDSPIWACTGRVVQYNSEGASDFFEEVASQDLGKEKREFSAKDVKFGFGKIFANIGKIFLKHMKSGAPAPWGIGHGSSMAFRKEVFDKIGKFDERFGVGAPFKSGEDVDIFYRVLRAGGKIVYNPSICVRHKHRLTADEVYKTRYGYSFGAAAIMKKHKENLLMRVMFLGRRFQLTIKKMQYDMTGNSGLSKAFGADLSGFRDGASAYCKPSIANVSQSRK